MTEDGHQSERSSMLLEAKQKGYWRTSSAAETGDPAGNIQLWIGVSASDVLSFASVR